MNEIICPHCKKAFNLDNADILKQVRDHQFEEEIASRMAVAEREKESAVLLAQAKTRNSFQEQLAKKEKELAEVKAKSSTELLQKLAQKENEINQMKARIDKAEVETKLAVSQAVQKIEKERDSLASNLERKELEKKNLENTLKHQHATELQNKEAIIKYKDEEIARVREMKQKLSTKMLGETLEQHCENEFNKLRASAFQNAYFEKDNEASGGTKGDFIFRETDQDGNEIISIMFEMKNQSEKTSTGKKNEDFFSKLDRDRKNKKCEYAVLVSLLEPENDLYNNGIVDVSHRFEKMYVIRPQFFIPIITLLRNAAMNSLKYKQELSTVRNQNIDITNFEDKITKFKKGFEKNYLSASTHFQRAIEEIDKSIDRMQKIKQELTTSENQLRLANQKAEDLTIKKLTYNNPTMKAKFDKLKNLE